MNRIESKIHCTHAHKKGKSKKTEEKNRCVCVYISFSLLRTNPGTDSVLWKHQEELSLILERERERKREGIDIKRKRKKKGVFPKSLKKTLNI